LLFFTIISARLFMINTSLCSFSGNSQQGYFAIIYCINYILLFQ